MTSITRSAEFKEIYNNVTLEKINEYNNQQGKHVLIAYLDLHEFLGKKTFMGNDLINIYDELHDDEALKISKALSKI